MRPEPPTIAHLKGHGLKGLFVTCSNPHCLGAAKKRPHMLGDKRIAINR